MEAQCRSAARLLVTCFTGDILPMLPARGAAPRRLTAAELDALVTALGEADGLDGMVLSHLRDLSGAIGASASPAARAAVIATSGSGSGGGGGGGGAPSSSSGGSGATAAAALIAAPAAAPAPSAASARELLTGHAFALGLAAAAPAPIAAVVVAAAAKSGVPMPIPPVRHSGDEDKVASSPLRAALFAQTTDVVQGGKPSLQAAAAAAARQHRSPRDMLLSAKVHTHALLDTQLK